jgi:hypothetical protein
MTQSTITGERTALGVKDDVERAKHEANRAGPSSTTKEDEDALLAAHYANMEDGEDDFEETEVPTEQVTAQPTPVETSAAGTATPDVADVMVFVAGVAKRLADVTDADEELMTPDEYEVSLVRNEPKADSRNISRPLLR